MDPDLRNKFKEKLKNFQSKRQTKQALVFLKEKAKNKKDVPIQLTSNDAIPIQESNNINQNTENTFSNFSVKPTLDEIRQNDNDSDEENNKWSNIISVNNVGSEEEIKSI